MNNGIGTTPDFSDGTEFLARLHGRLEQRQTRQTRLAVALSLVGAVALFITSFNTIARQIDEDQWNSYLVSEVQDELYVNEVEADLAWEIYLDDLQSAEDVGQLIDQVLELEGGEELLAAITLKG
ncbi:hypothetical protein ACFL6E_04445 [Candidatus Neomarinimicrobiota bacterium]